MRPTAPYGVKRERITAGFMKGGTRERYITPDLSFLSDDGGRAFPRFGRKRCGKFLEVC